MSSFNLKNAMNGDRCRTRDGKLEVKTININNNKYFPLSIVFTSGKVLSYTIEGNFNRSGIHDLDLVMVDGYFGTI